MPLHNRDKKLAQEWVELMENFLSFAEHLKNNPPKRNILEPHEYITDILISADASCIGLGVTIHYIINDKNLTSARIKLVRTYSKLHNSTIHSAELLAAHLATDLLTEEIRSLQLLLPSQEFTQINFFLAQDAHSTFLQFLKEPSNQYHYRLINKLKTKLQQASDMLNKQINLIYIKSAELPADVVSRAKSSFFVKKNFYEPLSFTENLKSHMWASVMSTEIIINKDFKHFNPTIKLENYGQEVVNHINHEAFPLERVGGNWTLPWNTFFNPKSKNALWTLQNCDRKKIGKDNSLKTC